MNKAAFFNNLNSSIKKFPAEEREHIAQYYDEMISDRIENGESEEAVINSLGTIEEIVKQLNIDHNYKIAREKPSTKGWIKVLISVLFILSWPIAVPLLFAALLVVFSLALAGFSVIFALFASFGAMTLASIINIPIALWEITFSPFSGFFLLGASILILGISLLALLAAVRFTPVVIGNTRKMLAVISQKVYSFVKKVRKK